MARTISTVITSSISAGAGDNPFIVTQAGGVLSYTTDPGLVFGAIGTAWIVGNDGVVASLNGQYGIAMLAPGTIDTGLQSAAAQVLGNVAGIVTSDPSTLINNGGTIGAPAAGFAGTWLQSGGALINGSDTNKAASITGGVAAVYAGGAIAVDNRGTLAAASANGYGLLMLAGGSVNNGTSANATASVRGLNAIVNLAGAATLTNAGTVNGTGAYGVFLAAGGTVTNGSAATPGGVIQGVFSAIYVAGGTGTVSNYGQIAASGLAGILLDNPGTVTNGTTGNTTASISGQTAGIFWTSGSATVNNFGTISSSAAFGMIGVGGGTINNGNANDTTATISAPTDGLFLFSGPVAVTNYGIIAGSTAFGILTTAATTINNLGAIVGGSTGIVTLGTGTVTNLSAIAGTSGAGLWLAAGGTLVNAVGASITGGVQGVLVNGAGATVTNVGTITGTVGLLASGESVGARTRVINAGLISSTQGAGGIAVQFADAGGSLVMQNGGSVVGIVAGAGDTTLDLAAAVGAISGIGTQYTGIGTLIVESGTSYTFSGSDRLSATGTFDLSGNISLATGATVDIEGQLVATAGASINMGSTGTQALLIGVKASGGVGSSFGTAITGVGSGDRIELPGVTGAGALTATVTAAANGTNTVTVTDGTGAVIYTLNSVSFATAGLTFAVGTDPANGALELLAGAPGTFAAPTLTASLLTDTGVPTDAITYNDSITGSLSAPTGLYALTATIDGGAATSILSFVSNGALALNQAEVSRIGGGALLEGAHVLTLTAVDQLGRAVTSNVSFTLDSAVGVRVDQLEPYVTTNGTLALTGEVIDNVTSITSSTVQLDTGAVVALPLSGSTNAFSINTANLSASALSVGTHDLFISATSLSGLSTTNDVSFTVPATASITAASVADTTASFVAPAATTTTAVSQAASVGDAVTTTAATLAPTVAAGSGATFVSAADLGSAAAGVAGTPDASASSAMTAVMAQPTLSI